MRIVLLAALLSACVVNSESQIDATWTIERLEGGETACPDSWKTAVLVASNATGRFETAFPCSDGGGESAGLADGAYTTSIEFRDSNNLTVASSLAQSFDVGGWNSPFAPSVYLDAGFVSASWSWGSDPRWCSDGFNPFEVIRVTLIGPTNYTHLFSCDDDGGFSEPLLPGTYVVTVGQGFSGHTLPPVTVTAPNHVTVLPLVTL